MGDNAANRELLTSGQDALMVRMADPDDLADAILTLKKDPALRARIADGGYRTFEGHCTPEIIEKQIAVHISELLARNDAGRTLAGP